MVNVLVIGATGYIGRALTSSLTRSGNHQVYGLARSEAGAKQLSAEEVTPIPGTISRNDDSISKAIESHRIDIVVDLSGTPATRDLLKTVVEAAAVRSKIWENGIKGPKLGFIYCSGAWVHGDSDELVSDLMPVGDNAAPNPSAGIVAWRPDLEREILAQNNILDVMIIRPALVYGRSSDIWSIYFGSMIAQGKTTIDVPMDINRRTGLVHVDDVATAFHAAIDKLPVLSGTGTYPVFDLVTSHESLTDVIKAAAKEFDVQVNFAGPGDNLFAQGMQTRYNGTSGRAKAILGWEPKRTNGFVSGMRVYAQAYKASHM